MLTLVVVRAVRYEPLGALLVAGLMTFGLVMRPEFLVWYRLLDDACGRTRGPCRCAS